MCVACVDVCTCVFIPESVSCVVCLMSVFCVSVNQVAGAFDNVGGALGGLFGSKKSS